MSSGWTMNSESLISREGKNAVNEDVDKGDVKKYTRTRNVKILFVFIQMQFGVNTEPWSGATRLKERKNK